MERLLLGLDLPEPSREGWGGQGSLETAPSRSRRPSLLTADENNNRGGERKRSRGAPEGSRPPRTDAPPRPGNPEAPARPTDRPTDERPRALRLLRLCKSRLPRRLAGGLAASHTWLLLPPTQQQNVLGAHWPRRLSLRSPPRPSARRPFVSFISAAHAREVWLHWRSIPLGSPLWGPSSFRDRLGRQRGGASPAPRRARVFLGARIGSWLSSLLAMAYQGVAAEYLGIPAVTRAYTTACVITTAAVQLELITPFQLYFNPDLIFRKFQLWRLVTNFLFFGPLGFSFFFNMIFLYRYCRMLEEGSFRGRTADFIFMFLFGGFLMTLFGLFASLFFLGQAFTIMLVYVWSRRNPYVRMNFFGLLNFQAPFLPWVLMGFSLLLGNSIIIDLLGIAVGHVYYFLEDVFPNQPGGKKLLLTPGFLKLVFDPPEEDPNYQPLPEDDLTAAGNQNQPQEPR